MSLRAPVWTTRVASPGADAFAILCGLEALSKALVAAALPIQTLELVGSDEGVSAFFLIGSVAALPVALLIPGLANWFGRTRLCAVGILLLMISAVLFMAQVVSVQVLGFVLRALGSAVFFAVLGMFIMDHVRRDQLGRSEPLRLLFVGLGWTFGPVLGVLIGRFGGDWAPFAASALAAGLLLAYFSSLRFASHPAIRPGGLPVRRASRAQLRAYFAQPRLSLAWLHAVGRGTFWITFNTYTPLFAVDTGLGAAVGGVMVGVGSGFMLAMPLWGWIARRFGIKRVSLLCFPLAAVSALAAGFLAGQPWVAAGFILLATLAMSIIDGYGNALFFRACKPSQRTAMTPIFSAQRDFSEISTTALFAVVLVFLPIQAVYVTLALILALLTLLSLKIHARL